MALSSASLACIRCCIRSHVDLLIHGCLGALCSSRMALASDCVTASLRVCQCESTLCVSCVAVEWCVETASSGNPGCEVLWVQVLSLSAP